MKKKLGFLVLLSAFVLPLSINAKEITKDTKLTEEVKDGIVVKSGTTATLDLGGQKVSNTSGDTIKVEKGAKLTITGTGDVTNSIDDKAVILNEGTLVINGGTYSRVETAKITYYVFLNHGTATIKGGTFKIDSKGVSDPSSIIANGWYDPSKNTSKEMSTLTIDNGVFEMNNNNKYIKNDDYGVMTVNGGSFTMNVPSTAVISNQGFDSGKETVTINGGTFKYYSDSTDTKYVIWDKDWHAANSKYTDNSKTYVYGGEFLMSGYNSKITNGVIDDENLYFIYGGSDEFAMHYVVAKDEELKTTTAVSVLDYEPEYFKEFYEPHFESVLKEYNMGAYFSLWAMEELSGVWKDKELDYDPKNVYKTDNPILVTFDIPNDIKAVADGYIRTYKIACVHDDKTDLLDTSVSEDGKEISFKADKFTSTGGSVYYALVYADAKEDAKVANPETSDINVIALIGLMALGTIGLGYTFKKRFN